MRRSKHRFRPRIAGALLSLRRRRWLTGAAALSLLGFAYGAHAAAPVEESVAENEEQSRDRVSVRQRGGSSIGTTDETSAGTSQPASQLGQLFYQMQLLRDEVQRLNGALEEQQHRIERLAREQHERYLGLDKRIVELSGASPDASADDRFDRRGVGTDRQIQQPGAAPTERIAYESAYQKMERREYEAAGQGFQQLIEAYPNGQFTPNAFYWLGELHRKNGDPESARQSFVQVVTLYPDHSKVPDALYKLGVVYAQLDELALAIEYLDRVLSEYPDSTAAGLAEQHAAELR
ncbi:MAG: tol-pal system protein YbgF [Gammaproteobacteria bacterium]|nr:tol-pal system protein YbgF [Gammaproteobacteria bacterium]